MYQFNNFSAFCMAKIIDSLKSTRHGPKFKKNNVTTTFSRKKSSRWKQYGLTPATADWTTEHRKMKCVPYLPVFHIDTQT
jgi:hypothetical protein